MHEQFKIKFYVKKRNHGWGEVDTEIQELNNY